jgi:hypothetical protein
MMFSPFNILSFFIPFDLSTMEMFTQEKESLEGKMEKI